MVCLTNNIYRIVHMYAYFNICFISVGILNLYKVSLLYSYILLSTNFFKTTLTSIGNNVVV